MSFWVCTEGTYRATAILCSVHTTFFNYHHFSEITNIPDEIILARIMTPFALESKRAMLYHNEEYDSDNDWTIRSSYDACMCLSSINN